MARTLTAAFGPKRTDEATVTISPYYLAYLALAGTIFVGVGAQTLFKIGSMGAESTTAQLLRVSTIAGLVVYLGSAILYVISLRQMSISTAFPTVSLGYLLIAAIDYFFFKEPIGLLQLGGLVLIMVGVAMLHR
jgi:small multidrug resistance pump